MKPQFILIAGMLCGSTASAIPLQDLSKLREEHRPASITRRGSIFDEFSYFSIIPSHPDQRLPRLVYQPNLYSKTPLRSQWSPAKQIFTHNTQPLSPLTQHIFWGPQGAYFSDANLARSLREGPVAPAATRVGKRTPTWIGSLGHRLCAISERTILGIIGIVLAITFAARLRRTAS